MSPLCPAWINEKEKALNQVRDLLREALHDENE